MTSEKAKQDALLDELLKDCGGDPKAILGEHGLLKQLTQRLVERALEDEMTAHVGYEPHAVEGRGNGNSRNGKGKKTVQSESGQFEISVPRDRNATFEPQLVKKRQRRLEGFDDKVVSLYARGFIHERDSSAAPRAPRPLGSARGAPMRRDSPFKMYQNCSRTTVRFLLT